MPVVEVELLLFISTIAAEEGVVVCKMVVTGTFTLVGSIFGLMCTKLDTMDGELTG